MESPTHLFCLFSSQEDPHTHCRSLCSSSYPPLPANPFPPTLLPLLKHAEPFLSVRVSLGPATLEIITQRASGEAGAGDQ